MHRLVILVASAFVLVACSSSDGGNTNTTAPSGADVIATGPTSRWSPDGRTIAFTQSASDGAQIFVVHPDGTDLVQVTDRWDGYGSSDAVWSPVGTQLVFKHGDGGQVSDLWVIDADGAGLRQLTDTPESEGWLSWLPTTG
jgi:TolB protein